MKDMKKRNIGWRLVIQSLPVAGAVGTALLPLQRIGQQFLILIVLLWIQVFFIIEIFLGK